MLSKSKRASRIPPRAGAGPAGTAATAYYAVWFYGFISAALLALLAGPVLRAVGVRVGGRDGNTPPSQA